MKNIENLSSRLVCRCIGRIYDLTRGSFPAVVRIETTNACNARCVICPHRQMSRPVRQMEEPLYTRIVDECSAHRCREIHLHNFGEPLLDKRLEERVRYAKRKGIAKVKIFSNGSLLSPERAKGLIEAGLDEIKISFDGATREEFEGIRQPLRFDAVVDNVRSLVAIRDELGSPMKVGVACCSTSDRQGTMRALEAIVDEFSFGKVHNWASGDVSTGRSTIRKPCSRLWRTFTILAGGEVALCCLDYDGQSLLGRIDEKTTIGDVFDGRPYQEARRRHREARQAELELCAHCTKSFL
jgi:MoaA/NifB/PqqE/SkfB family radical SAM enzyme